MKSRSEAVQIARGYLGTPYVLGGRLKGAGVDCGTLLGLYLIDIGVVTDALWERVGLYSHDWFQHASRERYLRALLELGKLTSEFVCRTDAVAQPGDLVLFRVVGSKLFNHGAIVTAWPRGIHAQADGVREVNLVTHRLTGYKPICVFDPFVKMESE
jgi:cell wall-associated NlpC family hydrolase